jgi:hypothetical protein
LLLTGLLLATGCRKPEDDLGLAVLDPADSLSTVVTDTCSITTWPRLTDAVQTSGLSANEVGAYLDDRFGSVVAGTATQVLLSTNNVGPADASLVCDSLVLSLAYTTTDPVYGDPDPQVIRVFRLNENLSADSIYHSDRKPAVGGTDLVQGSPRSFTPPAVEGDTSNMALRIPLSTDLGNELLALWGSASLADNASFLNVFKGLYITPDSTGLQPLEGGIWRLNLLDGTSKMTLYYHNGSGTVSTYDFTIGTSSARYSYVRFNRAVATDPGLATALADSSQDPQTTVYVQALSGLRSELRFPFLDRYAGTAYRAVAKAELVVPLAGEHHDTYYPPDQIFVFRKSDEGADLALPGLLSSAFDEEEQEYRFNITRWVQGVISGTYANTGLSLVAGNNGVTVNRATLAGPQNADAPMKLVLTFTTY